MAAIRAIKIYGRRRNFFFSACVCGTRLYTDEVLIAGVEVNYYF